MGDAALNKRLNRPLTTVGSVSGKIVGWQAQFFEQLPRRLTAPALTPRGRNSDGHTMRKFQTDKLPYVLCVDVGGPSNIGWADAEGRSGAGASLEQALDRLVGLLQEGRSVALGFEAPIWTPIRRDLARITSNRGGIEKVHNRLGRPVPVVGRWPQL
jgi:hypothetical protein